MSNYGAIFGAVDKAKVALRRKDMPTAIATLQAAEAAAQPVIDAGTAVVVRKRATGDRRLAEEANQEARQVNSVIQLRTKIRQVLANVGVGGGVPNGAGLFARVPFYSNAASGNVAAGSEWISLANSTSNTVTGVTPDIPYADYRIHGFAANAPRVGPINVVASDFKAKGFPNLFLGEGEIGVQSYDGVAANMGGLRATADIESPNTAESQFRSYTINDSAADAAPGSVIGIEASCIVEILDDQVYGNINSLEARRGGAGGLLSSMAAPGAGWVERIPMLVQTTDAFNLEGAPQAKLGWDDTADTAVASVALESEDIPYADSQVVGLEVEYIEGTDATYPHIVLLEDYKVKGGSSLFLQEGAIPAWNFLGDAAEYYTQFVAGSGVWKSSGGWGIHKRPALRGYPQLSTTNRIQLTVSAKNKINTSAALGANGSPIISYIQAWALVNRLRDDVFGAPGGAIEAMLRNLD